MSTTPELFAPDDDLAAEVGLRFGPWIGRRIMPGAGGARGGLYLAWPERRWVIFLSAGSNGWFDYRASDGNWFTCYSSGGVEPDSTAHETLADRFFAPSTGPLWPVGHFTAASWHLFADTDRLRIRHDDRDVWLMLYRDRPLWTFRKKPPTGREE